MTNLNVFEGLVKVHNNLIELKIKVRFQGAKPSKNRTFILLFIYNFKCFRHYDGISFLCILCQQSEPYGFSEWL